MMKLSVLNEILATVMETGRDDLVEALENEISLAKRADTRKQEKNAAKISLYSDALAVVLDNTETGVAMTAADVWESCADKLPENFSKSNLTYALSRVWTDVFTKEHNGKTNTYTRVV